MIGYSKDQQLNHGRLRSKKEPKFGKTKKPMVKKRITTDDELHYINYSKEQNYLCFVCGTKKSIELHHVKRDSTSKKDHTKIIPLCYNHHHGQELSPHGTPSKFRETFLMEVQEEYAAQLYEDYTYKQTTKKEEA